MNDAKPLASLSSSLLARKGDARPAMRPQSMLLHRDAGQNLEDLGWNDLGDDMDALHKSHLATVSALTPMVASPAQEQQADIIRAFEDAEIEEDAETEAWDQDDLQTTDQKRPEGSFGPAAARVEQPQPVAVAPVYPAATKRVAPGSKSKAAFTLRLDPDRHLRLRLLAAVSHRSAQQIVTQALDDFLNKNAPAAPFNQPNSVA